MLFLLTMLFSSHLEYLQPDKTLPEVKIIELVYKVNIAIGSPICQATIAKTLLFHPNLALLPAGKVGGNS